MNQSSQNHRLTLGQPAYYQIEVQARLSGGCAGMFGNLSAVINAEHGTTTLSGLIADQSALHGLLTRIRDLGLPLISVRRVQPEQHADR